MKEDMTKFIAKHPGIPYPSVAEIAKSHLVHPLHQAAFDQAVDALPPDKDPQTLEGRKNEELYRQAFMRAMDAAGVDALVFPTWAQLPAINGDRNTQITDDPKPPPNAGPTHLGSSLTFVGSMLQWPALSVPNGYIKGLPLGLQVLGRAWNEGKIIQVAYAYEQATHYRLPPPTVPPLVPHVP
jgi:Asp-tRNA(Asn)/Glu-tRNA(Gln) amidotransferase A subunit family amidase